MEDKTGEKKLFLDPEDQSKTLTAFEVDNDKNIDDQLFRGNKPLRWDIIFTNYMLSILFTGLAFGGSWNSQYSDILLMFGFFHFGFEMTISYYFIYTRKTAYILSIITISICILEGLINFGVPLLAIFSIQFIISDCLSFMSSICLLFNKNMPNKIKILSFAVSLHFIGVSLKLYTLPVEWYEKNVIPQHGAGWFWLALFCPVQVYLCRHIICGKINYIGHVTYDEGANSKCFVYFSKIGVPMIAFIILPVITFLAAKYRTTENETNGYFALGLWLELIITLSWPICMFCILWIAYIWVTSHPLTSNKKN